MNSSLEFIEILFSRMCSFLIHHQGKIESLIIINFIIRKYILWKICNNCSLTNQMFRCISSLPFIDQTEPGALKTVSSARVISNGNSLGNYSKETTALLFQLFLVVSICT